MERTCDEDCSINNYNESNLFGDFNKQNKLSAANQLFQKKKIHPGVIMALKQWRENIVALKPFTTPSQKGPSNADEAMSSTPLGHVSKKSLIAQDKFEVFVYPF
jgi:hypothetical protein